MNYNSVVGSVVVCQKHSTKTHKKHKVINHFNLYRSITLNYKKITKKPSFLNLRWQLLTSRKSHPFFTQAKQWQFSAFSVYPIVYFGCLKDTIWVHLTQFYWLTIVLKYITIVLKVCKCVISDVLQVYLYSCISMVNLPKLNFVNLLTQIECKECWSIVLYVSSMSKCFVNMFSNFILIKNNYYNSEPLVPFVLHMTEVPLFFKK